MVHNDIKNLNFVLGASHLSLNEARDSAIKYINTVISELSESTMEYVFAVPVMPITQADWDAIPYGYSCGEHPFSWTINVFKKTKIKGFIFSSFNIEHIFHINIIQVRPTCPDSPAKRWYTPELRSDNDSSEV